jgi:hypothetical protein
MPTIGAVQANEIISASADFVVDDWILSAGNYILDVAHNLDSEKVNVAIWENNVTPVILDRINVVNNNTIRLYVTFDPDCRFDGRAIIFKTQE